MWSNGSAKEYSVENAVEIVPHDGPSSSVKFKAEAVAAWSSVSLLSQLCGVFPRRYMGSHRWAWGLTVARQGPYWRRRYHNRGPLLQGCISTEKGHEGGGDVTWRRRNSTVVSYTSDSPGGASLVLKYELVKCRRFTEEIVGSGGVQHAHPESLSMQSYEFGLKTV